MPCRAVPRCSSAQLREPFAARLTLLPLIRRPVLAPLAYLRDYQHVQSVRQLQHEALSSESQRAAPQASRSLKRQRWRGRLTRISIATLSFRHYPIETLFYASQFATEFVTRFYATVVAQNRFSVAILSIWALRPDCVAYYA